MWITALLIGFAGSLHCVGMCSPLALAIARFNKNVITHQLIYNSGRILTYALLGAIISTIGFVLPFSGFQTTLSIVLGLTLVLMGVAGIPGVRIPFITPILERITQKLKVVFGKFLQQRSTAATFFLGMLNGLLPCGLTFMAWSYCLTLAGPLDGFNFMLLFGVGTLPAMLGLTAVMQTIAKKINISIQRLSYSLFILLGCLLIARIFIQHQHGTDSLTNHHQPTTEIVDCK